MTLLKPDVTLTDFGLAVECAFMAAWLHSRAPAGSPLRGWFVTFFAASSIGALLGGIAHGFLPDIQSTIYRVIWSATLLAIGIAALSSWAIGARLLFSEAAAKQVLVLAALLFAVYVAAVLGLSQSFAVAIIYYAPAVAFLLVSFVLTYLRRPRTYLVAGIAGLVLSFMAAAIQQTKTDIVSLGLSHNGLYHLVQAAALLLIFLAARGLMQEAACEHDATS
jgi:hypothetical protein